MLQECRISTEVQLTVIDDVHGHTMTVRFTNALNPASPWLGRWVADDSEAHTALWRLRGATVGSNLFIGSVRGWKMRDRLGVFDQFGALLQFPRYFGQNWNAFVEL